LSLVEGFGPRFATRGSSLRACRKPRQRRQLTRWWPGDTPEAPVDATAVAR
jgi:hypothetical protein